LNVLFISHTILTGAVPRKATKEKEAKVRNMIWSLMTKETTPTLSKEKDR